MPMPRPDNIRRVARADDNVVRRDEASAVADVGGVPASNTSLGVAEQRSTTSAPVKPANHAYQSKSVPKLIIPKLNEEEGVSACLLVNDENPRLPEWIAYHYITLPLRSLIVTVDPASRSSPSAILLKWYEEMGLKVTIWPEKKFLHPTMRGPCPTPEDADKCLWHHRDRQQYFVMKCMAEFKRMNKTWVLLTDVDEYVVFNQVREDDPAVPLDEAPEGVPTISNWRFHKADMAPLQGGMMDGTIDGKWVKRVVPTSGANESFFYGSVAKDIQNKRIFLRDDIAYHEAVALPRAPPGIPTLKDPWFAGTNLYVRIFNDTYDGNEDNAFVNIPMDWKIGDAKMRAFQGGSLIVDTKNRTYYMENEAASWPRRYKATDSLAARRRLPSVGEGKTVLDVLKSEAKEGYTNGAGLGPCLSMPRLLYGSREEANATNSRSQTAENDRGLVNRTSFVTLRYKWHASKGEFEASKYGKTIIDVSRIPMKDLHNVKALNIHRPLAYHCRKDPPRYAISLFRVNHYLDSFEAFSYRNDARSSLRQCKECYEKKGSGAAVAMDDDIQPWLRKFVEEVGQEKAKSLLANAGEFVELG